MLVPLYLLSLILLSYVIYLKPHLIVRPSVWFSIIMAIRISGASAFSGPDLDFFLEGGESLRFLTILFPVGVLVWVLASPGLSSVARVLYKRGIDDCCAGNPDGALPVNDATVKHLGLIFLALAGFLLAIYFHYVPLMSTGLVALITDPIRSSLIREESLKLVQSPLARYSFVWHTTVIAPILMALVTSASIPWFSWKNIIRIIFVVALLFSVMLTGARYPGGILILVGGVVFLLKKGVRKGGGAVAGAALVLMVLASFMTVQREGLGEGANLGLVYQYVVDAISHRVFVVPYLTGVWANNFAQDYGLLGVSSIRPLAMIFGVDYVNFANLVGLKYAENPLTSINAGTCFLFNFQASFGLIKGWALSLFLLSFLDFLLLFFKQLRGKILVAFLAPFLVTLISLTATNFFTCLISHGILPVAMVAFFVGKIFPLFDQKQLS